MRFEPINCHDLHALGKFQPEGWSDIVPDIEYYIRSDFCSPVKVSIDDKIVGIGAAIVYDTTAWLAHIIVDPDFRNRGIGHQMVEELLKLIKDNRITTCLLTATELGKSIYTKVGFRTVSEYIYLNREKPWTDYPTSACIAGFQLQYKPQILQMDGEVSGENRESLLSEHLGNSVIYIHDEEVQGFLIPGLKEGPIIAETREAGLELMKVKYSKVDKAVLPADNLAGVEFLKQNGFTETATKGTRMILGRDLDWQPQKIFSRIGGNFG